MTRARDLADLGGSADAGGITGKNLIINGNMACSQRGATFTSPSAGAYTLDRFKYNENFGAACTITQSTDVPSSDGFLNSMKIDITTAATPASAEEFKIDYGVEGQDFSRAGFGTSGAQNLTLSFWVKSNVTGAYRVNFLNRNGTGNKIVGGTYTINTASTWEKKTIAIPADTAQATYLTNAEGFRIEFYLASGPDRTSGSLPTDWIDYDATRRAAGHAVNLASSTSNEWYITGVQLEAGEATPFEHELFAVTQHKCFRYYQRAGSYSGFFTNTTGRVRGILVGQRVMRAQPTASNTTGITVYHKNAGITGATTIFTAPGNFRNGPSSFIDFDTVASSTVQGQGCTGDNNTDVRYFELDAEL